MAAGELLLSYRKVEKGRVGGAAEPSCERLSLSFNYPSEMESELYLPVSLSAAFFRAEWVAVRREKVICGGSNRVREASGIWNNA